MTLLDRAKRRIAWSHPASRLLRYAAIQNADPCPACGCRIRRTDTYAIIDEEVWHGDCAIIDDPPGHAKVIERVRNSGDRYTEAVHALAIAYCRSPGCLCTRDKALPCVEQAQTVIDWLVIAGYEDALRMMREATKVLKAS